MKNTAVSARVMEENKKGYRLNKILTKLMDEAHIDTAELSRHTGIPIPTINRLRIDGESNPTLTTLLPIANCFNITINQLVGEEEISPYRASSTFNPDARQTQLIPLLTIEQSAKSVNQNEYSQHQMIVTSAKVAIDAFAIVIKGSLVTSRFPENTILVFDRHLKPHDKDYVIIRLEGQQKPVLRQLLIDGDNYYFKPISPAFGGIILSNNHEFIGVMVQTLMNYRE